MKREEAEKQLEIIRKKYDLDKYFCFEINEEDDKIFGRTYLIAHFLFSGNEEITTNRIVSNITDLRNLCEHIIEKFTKLWNEQ